MNLNDVFADFVSNKVELNPDRIKTAKSKLDTIKTFLENSDKYRDLIIDLTPQGSYRQDTIIKPVTENNEFDVDALFLLKEIVDLEPKDYISNLKALFKESERYENIVDSNGKTRCVTLNYAGDFHMDIVPCIKQGESYFIMNKNDNVLEQTDADGYAEWFEEKNIITEGKLVTVIKLIKYLRDIKQNFSVKSVLITTLLGMQVYNDDDVSLYSDIPTALKTLINRLNNFLQSNTSTPIIINPVLSSENFNRHWDKYPGQYFNFKDKIKIYTEKINEALDKEELINSIKKLQEVFGDGFTYEIEKSLTSINNSISLFVLGDHGHKMQLSDLGLIDTGRYPYSVKIIAGLYVGSRTSPTMVRELFNSDEILPIAHHLLFKAIPCIPHRNYNIYWQVVNTGEHAKSLGEKALRGEIIAGGREKWEQSLYTGKHWVECFIVDSTNQTCLARSGSFYVNFENPTHPLK